MSLLARLFGTRPDPREALRPLWHRVVGIAREPGWYAKGGVADTVAGRFDAITLVLALVMLRMDGHDDLKAPSARLTELFVDDMDGQLRQSGVGDLVVGKRIGKLVSVLGGRMEALREGLAQTDDASLIATVQRNVTLIDGGDPAGIAAELRVLARELAALDDARLLAGEIAR
ncbi:MAG: ubiquinol-cytochrome C chaperone family protein [Sphingomonadales bacterium]|nr:ubiquinol-cytochrome C chaperone family protein [Sphingomonadales bacterium]